MARYIDADAVIKEIDAAQVSLESNNDAMWEINKKYYKGLCMARRIIDEQPTADFVAVVRCKDCIHKVVTSDGEFNPEDIVCDYHASDGFDSNDFCSFGEKADSDSTPDPAASKEVEQLIYKLECLLCHATGGLLSKHTYDLQTMESVVTDYIEKSCDEARAEVMSEVERLKKVLADKGVEYDQALQDKSRECNIAIDKIRLEHREEIRALQEKHEAELAKAKSEEDRYIPLVDENLTRVFELYKKTVVNNLLCEIKQEITAALDSNYRVRGELELSDELYYTVNGKIAALRGIEGFITEIENKYNKN